MVAAAYSVLLFAGAVLATPHGKRSVELSTIPASTATGTSEIFFSSATPSSESNKTSAIFTSAPVATGTIVFAPSFVTTVVASSEPAGCPIYSSVIPVTTIFPHSVNGTATRTVISVVTGTATVNGTAIGPVATSTSTFNGTTVITGTATFNGNGITFVAPNATATAWWGCGNGTVNGTSTVTGSVLTTTFAGTGTFNGTSVTSTINGTFPTSTVNGTFATSASTFPTAIGTSIALNASDPTAFPSSSL